MFDSFILILILFIVFGGLFFVAKYTLKIKNAQDKYNIGTVVTTFPISYKTNGYIVKIGDKHYFCCEGSGIIEIEFTEEMDIAMNSNSFKETLANDLLKLKNLKKKNITP